MKFSPKNLAIALGLAALGVAFAAAGISVGHTDDAPGAGLLGILLMVGTLASAVRFALRRPGEEQELDPKRRRARVLVIGAVTLVLAAMALALIAGAFWYRDMSARPTVTQQSEEVGSLERHVLPVIKDLRVTWYLNERFGTRSITWKRGKFTHEAERAREDGIAVFDPETEAAFARFSRAIGASGVPVNRLREATFAADGSLRTAVFQRRGGGIELTFTYFYSPGARPAEWTSRLGPVVLTRIGDTDWWFEQSPDD